MSIDRRQFLGMTASLAFARQGLAGNAPAPLRFGVVPYLTARRLATLYEPVRLFFERELGRSVRFSSAPDYGVHLERMRRHEYDLVADTLPVSRLAQRELGYVPIARTRVPLLPILIAAGESPLRKAEELRGGTVAVSDRLAALTLVGLRFLRDLGLQPGREVDIRVAGSHVNAIQRVLAGEADAAIVSRTALKQIEPALAARIRVVQDLPQALSAVVYTVSPALADRAEGLGRRLIEFATIDDAGRAFVESLGHQGLLPVGRELETVDLLVAEFYRQVNHSE